MNTWIRGVTDMPMEYGPLRSWLLAASLFWGLLGALGVWSVFPISGTVLAMAIPLGLLRGSGVRAHLHYWPLFCSRSVG